MNLASIEDVTEFVLDGTHASPIRTEMGIPVLSAQNVKDGVLDFATDRYTSPAEYEAFNKRLPLASGDVLLTIVGTIGRSAVLEEVRPLVFQRSVAVLRPRNDCLHSRFFYHVAQSQVFQAQLSRASNQSSQAGVYLGKLKKLQIPLRPSPISGELLRSWTRRTRCVPSAAPLSRSSTASPNPSSSTCSATRPPRVGA